MKLRTKLAFAVAALGFASVTTATEVTAPVVEQPIPVIQTMNDFSGDSVYGYCAGVTSSMSKVAAEFGKSELAFITSMSAIQLLLQLDLNSEDESYQNEIETSVDAGKKLVHDAIVYQDKDSQEVLGAEVERCVFLADDAEQQELEDLAGLDSDPVAE